MAGLTVCRSNLFAATILLLFVVVERTDALTFGVIGDWGMGGYPSGWFPEIRSALQFNQQCEFLNCNFTLSVGDNIYCGNVGECLQNSFEDGYKVGGMFFPSIGNHDNVGPQLEYTRRSKRWKFLGRTYSVKMPIDDTGYTIHIFALDTTDGSLGGGDQLAWLESELQQTDARWKVIFGHYPTVGSGRHKRVGTVGRMHDIMSKYNVQAFFFGHDHLVEMSNFNGRVLGLSGGMSRGGMMNRGLGGGLRRFTLTSPGEYNKYATDWPTHGFITVDLSPNVMNIQIWEANGGLYYDMSVTHDWLEKVKSEPSSMQHEWPSPATVLAAYKEEALLPRGPGGGVAYYADGSANPSSIGPQPTTTLAPGETLPPTTPIPPTTPTPPAPATAPPTLPPSTEAPSTAGAVPASVKYSVSTECAACGNLPTINVPFTVYVEGVTISSLHRMFLTSSALGCDLRENPKLLNGTEVMSPTTNLIPLTVTGMSTAAYVCFSVDKGKSYSRLMRSDTFLETPDFVVMPPLVDENGVPIPQATPTPPTSAAPLSTTALGNDAASVPPAPSPRSTSENSNANSNNNNNGGHSTLTIVVVGLLCVVGGIVGSSYLRRVG